MMVTRALATAIAASAWAVSALAMATLNAAPAQAGCSGPGYSGNPFDCQDQPGQGGFMGGGPVIDSSELPSQMGPNGSYNGGNWGRGLPGSSDPRFTGSGR
jgi:uncharacterized membrane protein